MKPLKSPSSIISNKSLSQASEDTGIEVLSLAGSQMNLSHREQARRKSSSRPSSSSLPARNRSLPWRRPASADFSDSSRMVDRSRHRGSTHSLCDVNHGRHHSRESSAGPPHRNPSLVQCQKAGFCGSDALIYEANTGHRCPHGRKHRVEISAHHHVCQIDPQVEVFDPDVMRYAYTAESARLLQTLLRESWHSDDVSQPNSSRSHPRPPSPSSARDRIESSNLTLPNTQDRTSARSLSPYEKDRKQFVSFSDKIETEVSRQNVQENIEIRKKYLEELRKRDKVNTSEKNLGEVRNYSKNSELCPIPRSTDDYYQKKTSQKHFESDDLSLGSEVPVQEKNAEQDLSSNLDSIPSKDTGRTESTLCLRDAEQASKKEESDFNFERWLQNNEKTVKFIDSCTDRNEIDKPLIDLTERDTDKVSARMERSADDVKVAPRDSTFEDLVNILHVLENEADNEDVVADSKETVTAASDMQASLRSRKSPEPTVNEIVEAPKANSTGTQVAEIFQYLDQAERCSEIVKPASRAHQMILPTLNDSVAPRIEELLCRSTVDLAQEVVALRLQAEEQAGGIRLLQQTVAELKEANKSAHVAHQTQLNQAANEAEAALQRHQKMAKQLLAEKKSLNEKIAGMMTELKGVEERHQRNLKAMEERHLVEIQRVKETHAAAEKLKREKWIDVKTQKIKEMTVKGLEPELSRMAARQQQEISELRALHRSELEAVELRSARRTTELMDELRSELARDKEDALQREAALLRAKWEKRLEGETRIYEEESRRLKEDLRRERDRITALEVHVQEQLLESRRAAERDRERDRAAMQRECQERLEEAQRQHQVELKSLKEALEMEKDIWMNNYKKIQANKFLEREADLHHQYKRERDRDIEIAIERLENEATKARLELTEAAENRLKRLRDKLETELGESEVECASLKNKLAETRELVADKEDKIVELSVQIRQLQSEYGQLKKIADELNSERTDLREILRAELDEQLKAAQQTSETLRQEMAHLKTTHAVELARRDQLMQQATADADKQLEQVYARVKATIRIKDEALETQKEQYKVVLERCSHLELMLENQRKNLLLT